MRRNLSTFAIGLFLVFMKNDDKAVQEAGLDNKVKIMVGGASVTQSYADEIGADGYAPDAASAVAKAKELLEKDF